MKATAYQLNVFNQTGTVKVWRVGETTMEKLWEQVAKAALAEAIFGWLRFEPPGPESLIFDSLPSRW